MSDVPDDLKYTAEHEWVRVNADGKTIRVGITDYAQSALGDVVYVSLPAVGASVDGGAAFGEVESTKSVSDLYAPVGGTVSARNDALDQQPIAFAQHRGRRGHPVGFAAELFSELVMLKGDEGARRLLARYPTAAVELDDPGVLLDIDTVDDPAAAQRRIAGSSAIAI